MEDQIFWSVVRRARRAGVCRLRGGTKVESFAVAAKVSFIHRIMVVSGIAEVLFQAVAHNISSILRFNSIKVWQFWA